MQKIFKIADKGEGKSEWLAAVAHYELQNEPSIYFMVPSDLHPSYREFMERYFTMFGYIGKIEPVSDIHSLPHNSVLLMDNLFSFKIDPFLMAQLEDRCKRCYITETGTVGIIPEFDANQISIFDNYEVVFNG